MIVKDRKQICALVVWRLPHGDFVAVDTTGETMHCAADELQEFETNERAATRVAREKLGVDVISWQQAERPSEAQVMVAVLDEAPLALTADAHWVDVEQLPMLTVITGTTDLLEAYLALQEFNRESATH